MSLAEPDRSEVIAWGVAECGAVLLLFVCVFMQRLRASKVFVVHTKSDKIIFQLLGIWFGACVVSAALGIVRGNQWDYLLGDFYRFGSLPIVFALIYFSVKDGAEVHKLLRGFVAVYGLMVALDLVRFNSFIREEQERLTTETAHQAGMIAAAVIYLMLFDRKRWVRRSSVVVLLLMMVLLLRAQMLTPLITLLLTMALFFSFSRRFVVFLGCGIAAAILVVASFYSVSVAPEVPAYIADKFLMAQQSEGPLESLEALSGVRLGEIISIEEELAGKPSNLLFGTGEGSLVSPDPLPDPSLSVLRFTLDKHYVHAGLIDALYHNGVIAVGALLLLLLHLFRRSSRMYSRGNPFGLFVMVTLMVTLLLLSYDLPFESAVPLLALCFSGVSVMESSPKLVAMPIDARASRLRLRKSNKNAAYGVAGADASAS